MSALVDPPMVPGALPLLGHMLTFGKSPFHFMMQARRDFGEIVEFRMFHQRMLLLTGGEASSFFFRGRDEDLDQSAAYKLMTPIFGKGLLFDAPIEKKNTQLKMLMPALRDRAMRGFSTLIEQEAEGLVERLAGRDEFELVEAMKELTIYTSSHCLLGPEIRFELNEEFSRIYHDLEQGVHPIAYIHPYLPLPIFRRRDRARARLQELVTGIIEKRKGALGSERGMDMFQLLLEARYPDGSELTPYEITGLLVGAVFAGHHTSSGTAAWVLIELLRRPEILARCRRQVDEVYGRDGLVDFESLRRLTELEKVIKEVLRLHPPLILLMRKITRDLEYKGYRIEKGTTVCISPPVTHRIPEHFPNPEIFDPDRYGPERAEDANIDAWQPFGGGRHKCSGNAFAVFQIKTIFAVLLRRLDFELVDPPDSYHDDYTQMIVQPKSPCRVRQRPRTDLAPLDSDADGVEAGAGPVDGSTRAPLPEVLRIEIDGELCQGHAVCMGAVPEVFRVREARDAQAELLVTTVRGALVAKVERARRLCPNQAIRCTAGEAPAEESDDGEGTP